MSKVKYIRTSSVEQNNQRQQTNSNEFSKVYIDKCSGSIKLSERKEGKKLLADIQNGIINQVHVSSIDRLGRSILDLLSVIEYLTERDINVYVENIGMYSMIDSKPNPTFKMIVSVLGNVAEMERNLLLERQAQGIALAKARGTYKGRLYGSKMKDEDVLEKYKKVAKELKSGQSLRRAAAIGKCSLGTAQKVMRLLSTAA